MDCRKCYDIVNKDHACPLVRHVSSYQGSFGVFSSLRQSNILCDVVIIVENSRIPAHRLVLASYSPYFYSMFTNDMVEARNQEITISNIDAYSAKLLIEFAYGGEIHLDKSNVQSLFTASDLLQIDAVREACREFIIHQMDSNNCLGIRAFADTYSAQELMTSANQFINRSFTQVTNSDEYFTLSVKQMQDLLSRDQLNVGSEEEVFQALLKWIEYDLEERSQYLSILLNYVRLPLLSPRYLAESVANEKLIRTNIECRDLVDEAKDAYLVPAKRLAIQKYKLTPRCFNEEVGYVYAIGGLASTGNSINTVERYDNLHNDWSLDTSMMKTRSRVGTTLLCNCIYAIGGVSGTERLSTVERLDLADDDNRLSWQWVASMRVHRSALCAVTYNSHIYAIGGYDGNASLRSTECYNSSEDAWHFIEPMITCRSAAGAATFGSRVYVMGGHDGLSIFDTVEVIDMRESNWRPVKSMVTKRCRLGVATLDNRIYACGGYDGKSFLNTVECFDPIAEKWTLVAPMLTKRGRVAVISLGGKLYAVGGYDGSCHLKSVECYDPRSDKWSYVADMAHHVGGVGVVATPHFL